MATDQLINKALDQVGFKSRCSGNCRGSGGGSSTRSDITCHKYGKKGHINKYFKSKVNGSGGNPSKKSSNDLPEWVTKKPIVSDTKDLATSTINRKGKKYKWCTSCNNGIGAWGFYWKDEHE